MSINAADFTKLVRGEIVEQGELQAALQDVGYQQMFNALVDAIVPSPLALLADVELLMGGPRIMQEDTEEIRRWVHGINCGHPTQAGDFLLAFAATVCRADYENYPILRPALLVLKGKFPRYRFEGDL